MSLRTRILVPAKVFRLRLSNRSGGHGSQHRHDEQYSERHTSDRVRESSRPLGGPNGHASTSTSHPDVTPPAASRGPSPSTSPARFRYPEVVMADLCGVLGQPMEDEVFLLEPFDDREPTHRDHQVVALDGFGE